MAINCSDLERAAVLYDGVLGTLGQQRPAGVYVFGGGIDEDVAPVLVHADGSVTPETSRLDGGLCVLEFPSRARAKR